ncbi:MAG: hypothetical protein M0R77_00410 [Gammaproteobacteria bacterium]|nr:hypothetical protein [Acholeplasmataceae bacterium]MCK9529016.1 hypothetical protein [Gammaproteobacteria bacterium]
MEDRRLGRLIDEDTPQLNRVLADGVATTQLKRVVEGLDFIWRSASDSFVPGLTYHGIRHCNPREIYQKMTASRKNSRRVYETSRSNVFMVKILLKYEGNPLPDYYLWLPAPEDGGYIDLRGSRFVLSPILNDIVFSPANENTIFVRLPRTRINFERLHHVFAHNEACGSNELNDKEIVQVTHGKIHQSKDSPHIRAKTTLMHYLLGRYGFDNTFLKHVGFIPEIGYEDINIDRYPPSDWVICASSGNRPKACNKNTYRPSKLRLAIPKDKWSQSVKNMVAGFYYIVDHAPERVNYQWIKYERPERLWRILLGLMTYQAGRNEEIIDEKIVDHYRSLNHYVDTQAKLKLQSIGLGYIEDFYELLWYIMENINQMLLDSSRTLNSMYGKELNVVDFVMQDINNAIFLSVFDLTQRLSTKKILTEKDVVAIFNRYLKTDLIFGINKPSHGEVTTQAIPNDNKALRLTTLLVPQSANDSKRNKKLNLLDPAIRYHPSISEVGGYTVLPKSSPDGRRRLNTCVQIDENYKIVRNERFVELLDTITELTQK